MAGSDVQTVIDWAGKLSGASALLLFILGLVRGWWHMHSEVKAMDAAWQARLDAVVKDRDEWKIIALTTLPRAERAVGVATAAVPAPEPT